MDIIENAHHNEPISKSGYSEYNFSAKDITLTALFAVIISICSWISVPTEIPFTLQTFAVFCAVLVLGGRRGFFAVLVYIMLALVGIPVLAGFTGGAGVVFGTTGGYLLGFLLITGIYYAAEKIFAEKFTIFIRAAVLVIGLFLCYIFGTVWFMQIYLSKTGEITVGEALKWCVIPFIIPDMIKLAAALALSEQLKRRINV